MDFLSIIKGEIKEEVPPIPHYEPTYTLNTLFENANGENESIIMRDIRKIPDISNYPKDIYYYTGEEDIGIERAYHNILLALRDVKGNVVDYVIWTGDYPKYIDGNISNVSLYGMEQLPRLYKTQETLYLTEGIFCAMLLRSKGLNAMALLGSYISEYTSIILNRLNDVVLICDNDSAGIKGAKLLKSKVKHIKVVVSDIAKDVEDSYLLDSRFIDAIKSPHHPSLSSLCHYLYSV